MSGQSLYDKLWNSHVVRTLPGGDCLLNIDRQLVHEVSSPQSFAALRSKGIVAQAPPTAISKDDRGAAGAPI